MGLLTYRTLTWKFFSRIYHSKALTLHPENNNSNRMKTTRPTYCVAFAALCSVLLAGCGKKTEESNHVAPVAVKEMIVGQGTGATYCSGGGYSGTVEEANATVLSLATGGTLQTLTVKVGDRVKKGQLVACVDPTTARNAYDMAHTTRLQADDACRRMKQLHDKGSLPEIKWVEAQSQLQQAVAAEAIARKSLADCRLYAPVSGVVSEKCVETGQNVMPGAPVVKVVSTRVLDVKISVPESEVAKVSLGQRAMVSVPALGGKTYSGRVGEKGVVADPISRSYGVKIRISQPDDALLPGMVTSAVLEHNSSASASAEVVVPARLVQLADDNSTFVWTDEGGKAVRRPVVCGEYRADGVVIVSGLHQGDRLIIEGQQKVCNGTLLKSNL